MAAQTKTEDSTQLRGVILAKVELKTLQLSCKKLKIAADKGDRDAMVVALSEHFIRLHKDAPTDIVNCDRCQGPSDLSVAACPYCGKRDEEPEEPAEAPKEPPKAEAPAGPALAKVKGKGKSAAVPEEPKAAGKLSVVKGGKAAKTEPEVHRGELVTVDQLDAKVGEIKKLETGIADSHWKIGRLLGEVWEQNLHLLRKDENGKQKYRSWGAWVEQEIGYGPKHGLDLIAVSKFFDEKTIAEVGVTKLRPMCKIPDEAKRENLLERARGELLTRDQIEEEARLVADGKGRPNLAGRKPTAAEMKTAQREAREKAEESAKEQGVTAVIVPGLFTVPAFSDEAKKKSKKPVRAHDVADKPSATYDMLNGIKLRVSLVNEPEGLSFLLEFTREN